MANKPMTPRASKDPRSVEYARQTISFLKLCLESEHLDCQRIERERALIKKYKHWEVLGYTSEADLLKGELGVLAQHMAADPNKKAYSKPGRPRKEDKNHDDIRVVYGSTGAEYLVRRLKRDRPDIAVALARGEYKSARQAAIAAGIVKVPTPLEAVKRAIDKLSASDEKKLCDWLQSRKQTPK